MSSECPDSVPYPMNQGNALIPQLCCSEPPTDKQSKCSGTTCCAQASSLSQFGCAGVIPCHKVGQFTCPKDVPYVFGDDSTGWYCCGNINQALDKNCKDKLCCAQAGTEVGCGKTPCCSGINCSATPGPQPSPQPGPKPSPQPKTIFEEWWFWVIVVSIIIIILLLVLYLVVRKSSQ